MKKVLFVIMLIAMFSICGSFFALCTNVTKNPIIHYVCLVMNGFVIGRISRMWGEN